MSLVLVFLIVFLIAYFIKSKYRIYLIGSKVAGQWAVPLIGNIQMITKLRPESLFLTVTEDRKKFKQTYRLWLGPQLWVFLHTPEETKDALNDSTLVKPEPFKQLNVLIGNGLLVSHGNHWDTHRRALGPAFHPNVLNTFTGTITHHAEKLINKLQKTVDQRIDVGEYLFPCILDAIIDTSMGKYIDSQNDESQKYTKAFHTTSELLFKRMMNPFLSFDFIFKRTQMYEDLNSALNTIHELMESVIEARADYLKNNSQELKKQRTLLDTLLTANINGKPLSFRDIRDEVNTFVFAGVDTTTAAMEFVFYCLGRYPTEQLKLISEIQSMQNDDKTLTMEDINSLAYLDMFIKESLRLYTIVPLTGRQTTQDTLIGNRLYCLGTTVWVNMYGLAHDEDFFENPDEFQPQRFSKEAQQKLPPFCYIPFSGGPHVCIGRKYALMIMKILTVHLLQNFEVILDDPEKELILMAQMTLKSKHGIKVRLRKRT